MPIRLFDSLTREVRELKPSPDGVFRFYNCGLTVYASAHIGNFRTFVINDVLRRLLIQEYGENKVHYVRNLTDVDDKTIQRARQEGRPLDAVTRQWTEKFHIDCDALNCLHLPGECEPRATDPRFIKAQINMIEVLMEKGNAYRAPDGSVYFKVSSFPDYGALSRLKERELRPGAVLAVDADEKEDGSDFALWKAWKEDDGPNKWSGPRGAAEGRPGWHIECSAMSKALLGDTIDLHTGGVDLLFPHHENEIAQSQCCNGAALARHWFHSEHLLVDGKKMSKSLGNFYTLDDLQRRLGPAYDPMQVRYALLNGHPRKQLNFVFDSLHASWAALSRLKHFDHEIQIRSGPHPEEAYPPFQGDWGPFKAAWDSLCDDLNLPESLGQIFTVINRPILSFNGAEANVAATAFRQICIILGLEVWKTAERSIPAPISVLAEKRWAAKQARDFKAADALRAELTAAGWSMLDGKDGYKLEPLKP